MTRPRVSRRVAWSVALCVIVGTAITGAVTWRVLQDGRTRTRTQFTHGIDQLASLIDEQISEDVAILHSVKALFDASEEVTRAEFLTFTDFVLSRYPSMRAIGWAPRVTHEERDATEAAAQQDSFKGFHFTEASPTGGLVRAAARDEYYPVFYIEPLEGNEAALAFDLISNPDRRATVHSVRDTGTASASSRIRLVQDAEEEWAVLFMVPVYAGTPKTVDERRSAIQGVVSGVFRFHDLLLAAGAHIPDDGMIDLRMVDATVAGDELLLHETKETAQLDLVQQLRHEKQLKPAGGRQWKLIATPSTAFVALHRTRQPSVTALVGLLVTASVAYVVSRLTREKQHVEAQVQLRTRELREQGASLEKEMAKRSALQARVAKVTDQEQRRLGQELHDSLGQQVSVVSMLSQSLAKRLQSVPDADTQLLSALTESAENALRQVRALSKGLLPIEVERGGLGQALGQLVASTRGLSDAEVSFTQQESTSIADQDAASHLYRIAQEALRNALEHGHASKIAVQLSRDDGAVTLSIADDGSGLADGNSSTGSGLESMRHRAESIGATLSIGSADGSGTTVTCRLPTA